MDIFADAERALAEIAARVKGSVYASRKGVVAGANFVSKGYQIVFRRVGARVHVERWEKNGCSGCWPLSTDLERRAAAMLDSL